MDPYEDFDDFVMSTTVSLSRTAYVLTGDHHMAEDLLQVAYTRVAERWPTLRGGSPQAYARQVLLNEFLSWRRRRRYFETPTGGVGMQEMAGNADMSTAVVRRLVVGQALRQLAPRQRAVLVLRFYEDLSEADAARILGCTVGTVKSQTHQALARLRAVAPQLVELLPWSRGVDA